MEGPAILEPVADSQKKSVQDESAYVRKYKLCLNNSIYSLAIENLSKENILFKLRQINNISYTCYLKNYSLDNLIKELNLPGQIYNQITKIFELFDLLISNNKIKIDFYNRNMNLCLKLNENSCEKEYTISLIKDQMDLKEMVEVLIEEINEIKNKDKISVLKSMNDIKGDNDLISLENKMQEIDKEIIEKYKERKELEIKINNLKNNVKKIILINDKDMQNNTKKNEINLVLKVDKDDIGKEIKFFNSSYPGKKEEFLSQKNVDVYINNVKYEFKNSDFLENEGLYTVTLKFKINIKDCVRLFYQCKNIISADLSNFNSSNVDYTIFMFGGCENLMYINLSNFNTSKVVNMRSMFEDCKSLMYIDVSNFDTSITKDISSMFLNCASLRNIDLSSFNLKNCGNIMGLFKGCTHLTNVDLSSLYANNIEYKDMLLIGCYSLRKIKINSNSLKYFESIVNEDIVEIVN